MAGSTTYRKGRPSPSTRPSHPDSLKPPLFGWYSLRPDGSATRLLLTPTARSAWSQNRHYFTAHMCRRGAKRVWGTMRRLTLSSLLRSRKPLVATGRPSATAAIWAMHGVRRPAMAGKLKEETIEVWEADPSTTAFTDLMNRAPRQAGRAGPTGPVLGRAGHRDRVARGGAQTPRGGQVTKRSMFSRGVPVGEKGVAAGHLGRDCLSSRKIGPVLLGESSASGGERAF